MEVRVLKNVFRVVKRDLLRLLKSPAALTVVTFLLILPSLYTWFNVAGFWDPYSNTSNLKVYVVNEDDGASTDLTGSLDLGEQVVDQLETNDQLGWEFSDRATAMEAVRSGEAYAAFIIPSDFSYDITTLLTGDFTQPTLEYYVNEKANAVAPKITDTGATTLDDTINSIFVSTVSETVVEALNDGLDSASSELNSTKSSVSQDLSEAIESIATARSTMSELSSKSSEVSTKAQNAKASLQEAKSTISDISTELEETSKLLASTQTALGEFTTSLMSTLDSSSVLASSIAIKTNSAIQSTSSAVAEAQTQVDSALASAQAAADANTTTIAQLSEVVKSLSVDDATKEQLQQALFSLQTQNDALQTEISSLQSLSSSLETTQSDIAAASDTINTATQSAISSTDSYRSTLSTETFPAINNGMSQLTVAIAALSTAVSNQELLIDQSSLALDQLSSALDTTSSALSDTDSLLGDFESDLDTVRTDVLALGTSGALAQLMEDGGLDAAAIADFMESPTEIETVTLYAVNAYGSAMAPFFMNLSLWIGVFMLLVILRQEVDDEGIPGLTVGQRFISKWLFLAPLTMIQAAICCTGNLVLGVEVASLPLFYITSMFASLTYLSIQYTLSMLFQHIGKGLCVIFIFVQIPGATGLYPIEMTPDFFQAVYPLFPFTYGINALRETVAGFYGNHWLMYMGVLLAFLLVFFFLGLKLRPYFTNFNRMTAKQVKESDILNGEEVHLPARRYRMEQLFRLLADRDEYRDTITASVVKFAKWYPRLHKTFPLISFVIPVVITLVLSLNDGEKVIMLTVWLIWLVALFVFMIVVEFIRDKLEHELSLSALSDEDVRALFQSRDGISSAPAPTPLRTIGRRRK